ncbi:MAG: hypothetical protein ACK53L_12535, partial [Pirellulaceae bacterium]
TAPETEWLVDRSQLTVEAMVQGRERFLADARFDPGFGAPASGLATAGPPPRTRLLYFWGLDVPSVTNLSTERLAESQALTTLIPLYLVQAWERLAAGLTADLYL